MTDAVFMARALFHAERGRGRTSPNPMVGAIVVSADGVVVGQGFHERAGEAHAEVRALMAAGARAKGGTLYCTLEPCCHQGRTGPCVPRILDAGIARVVAAVEDPNPVVHGQGFTALRDRGVTVDVGVERSAAVGLNRAFFTLMWHGRPFVVLKAATSLDGRIAAAVGVRTRLTSEAANRHAHRARAEVDAIGVGVGTILVDDPQLTVRGVYRGRPLTRVIFDRQLRTPPASRVLSTRGAGPVIIVTSPAGAVRRDARLALEDRGAEIEVTDGTVRDGLRRLGQREISSVVLEGGAALHAAAWDERVVDCVRLYVTPRVLGPDGVPLLADRSFSTVDLFDRRLTPLGPDTLMEGHVHRSY
jgi:diaminohydroxyphosphoribosylaminopyrimidine deaminase/5-amino-6-(5-phosphoribosylamino)uracil reductase